MQSPYTKINYIYKYYEQTAERLNKLTVIEAPKVQNT